MVQNQNCLLVIRLNDNDSPCIWLNLVRNPDSVYNIFYILDFMNARNIQLAPLIKCIYVIFPGYAIDPTVDTQSTSQPAVLGDTLAAEENKGTVIAYNNIYILPSLWYLHNSCHPGCCLEHVKNLKNVRRWKWYLSQLMRLWYLSHRRSWKYGSWQRVRQKIRHLAPLDGCACVFEEWVYGGWKVP